MNAAAGFPAGNGPEAAGREPAVVALGGGHGLSASLSALRHLTDRLTAVVTVADDGGSSGRLRRELGVLPPGDLRMALAALCDDSAWGRQWRDVLQHRFTSAGALNNHSLGNLLIVALWEQLDDPVAGLDWVGRLLQARGRVLPMAAVALDIEATVRGIDPENRDRLDTVRGQAAVATTPGRVESVRVLPHDPPACPEAVSAVSAADWVVLGPGSWFTSVLPHLLVPQLADALQRTSARRCLTLNLSAQPGETEGFRAETHLDVIAAHAPDLRWDAVLADPAAVEDTGRLARAVTSLGAHLYLRPISFRGTARHDPLQLAAAYRDVFAGFAHPGTGELGPNGR
jgi:uncharacterized cofD-like protein